MTESSNIEMYELIARLAIVEGNEAEEAQHALSHEHGFDCIEDVISAYPTLPSWGKICALDLFCGLAVSRFPTEEIRQAVEEFATETLNEESELLREYSAFVLGEIELKNGLAGLLGALERSKAAGTPQDYPEPIAIRRALRKHGHETRHTSSAIQNLMVEGQEEEYWNGKDLGVILAELLENRQMVVAVSFWRIRQDGKIYWQKGEKADSWEPDYSKPFVELVEASVQNARRLLRSHRGRKDLLVSMDWITEINLQAL